jgi:hypothetical protein
LFSYSLNDFMRKSYYLFSYSLNHFMKKSYYLFSYSLNDFMKKSYYLFSYSRKSPVFTEPKGSLPCSQGIKNGHISYQQQKQCIFSVYTRT